MHARFASALFGALSTLGCADMLGLGGLTFEQEASGGAASVGGTPGAGGSTGGQGVASGGVSMVAGAGGEPDPPEPPSYTDEYPVTWKRGALVTTAWHGYGPERLEDTGAFWVYDPTTGSVASHRLDLEEPDLLGESLATEGADLLYSPVLDGHPWLFAYDAPTGLVEYGEAPIGEDPVATDTQAGSPDWTHLVLAGDPHDPFLIAADSSTRLVRIGPADPGAEDPLVTSVTWDADFTELLPFRRADADGILRLDSELGEAAFVPIEDGAFGEEIGLQAISQPGWSLATTYQTGDAAGVLLYRSSDGTVETLWQEEDGELYTKEGAHWRRDLSAIVPVSGGEEPWAVTYDASTGVADVRKLEPLEESIVVK